MTRRASPARQGDAIGRPLPSATRAEAPTHAGEATAGDARCFLCGRPFRPTYGEPIAGGDDVQLCVSCGALYELPDCCA